MPAIINLGWFLMFLFLKIKKYYIWENQTWQFFSSSSSVSKSNLITMATKTAWEKRILHSTYTIHMANSTKVSQTSTARRESTKDRRECKLPAVRKTRARDLRANWESKSKTVIQRQSVGKQDECWNLKKKKTEAPDRVKVAHGHNDGFRKQQFCNLLFKN